MVVNVIKSTRILNDNSVLIVAEIHFYCAAKRAGSKNFIEEDMESVMVTSYFVNKATH